MKDKKIIDAYQSIQPDLDSRQRVLTRIREKEKEETGKKHVQITWLSRTAVAAVLAGIIFVGGITSYAVWYYLTPSQVADEFEDKSLSSAFQSEDAVFVNEKQTLNGYEVCFEGMVSGSGLSDYLMEADGEIKNDRTYCVIAIRKTDGSGMPELSDEEGNNFLISPFIQGQSPFKVNIFVMNGVAMGYVRNGVLYKIIDCDELGAFADKEVYLAVMEGRMPSDLQKAYIYKKDSGETIRNQEFPKMNALFTLPFKPENADQKKADRILKSWGVEKKGKSSDTGIKKRYSRKHREKMRELAVMSIDEIQREWTLVKEAVQTFRPDENGEFQCEYKVMGSETGRGYNINDIFSSKDRKQGTIVKSGILSGSDEIVKTELLKMNKDGSVTVMPYYIRIS